MSLPVRRRTAGLLALGVGIFVLAAGGCSQPPPALPPPEAPTVAVKHPASREYTPVKEFTGRLQTKDPVTVVPQVSGMLLRRAFEEGKTVEKDKTVLFEIDKTLFEADLNKAKADVARAEADTQNWAAQIKLAEAELSRADDSYKRGATAKTDLDKATANVDVAKAQLEVARAAKASAVAAKARAAENLRYCTIYAPATGRTGRTKVAEKSVVDAYKTVLVDVYPVDPIYAVWEVDELTSLWYREQVKAKRIGDPRMGTLMCAIIRKNEKAFSPPQPVEYYDPEIVRGTGTRTIRARFPNPDADLSSGDSVRVRVDAGRPQPVLTIPETAVFAQQRRRYVYVAAAGPDGDKAELREVETGPAFDGLVVVEKGLAAADRVVVDNLLRVRPGVKVQAKP